MVRFAALVALGVLLLVVVISGCGRTSLEPETLDSGIKTGPCGPSTCPDGCCDENGQCRTGTDLRACGSIGGRCSDCVSSGFNVCTTSGVCGKDDPTCSSRTCTGCCAVDDGRLRCLSGTEPAACGKSGQQCANCASTGRACEPTTRACGTTRCDSTTCKGCCVGDQCLTGESVSACGSQGQQCSTCSAGQQCISLSAGGGGCEGPTVKCGPGNCVGCCTPSGKCVSGFDTTACGQGGQTCDVCGTLEVCTTAGGTRECRSAEKCGPNNCKGCCVGDTCLNSTSSVACGIGGEQCKTCGKSELCDPAGDCVLPTTECNALSCPSGCCVGDICAVGTQATACGTGGAACQNCAGLGLVCQGNKCQPPACGPATCPNGCCQGNTCVVGNQDKACGKPGGAQCSDCTLSGQKCQGNQCVSASCGPANCAGCCQANGVCDPLGINNNSCGQGGAACSNCTLSGSFCNGLVSPRRCNNQQTTCPASYTQCAPGVSMPVIAQQQKLCTDAQLGTLTAPCAGGPDTAACVAAVAALPAACRTCLAPFNFPFDQRIGLWACAASSVTGQCRRALGCAADCTQKSCTNCASTSEDQCYALVSNPPFGQCAGFTAAATCASVALAGGLCSQFSYANYGAWLRGVGDQFCGNGP